MRLILIIVFVGIMQVLKAQNNTFDAVSPAFFKNGGARVYSEAGINSNTFTGTFFAGLLDGRTYSGETMSKITNRAGLENRAGADFHTGFNVGIKLNNQKNDDLLLTIGAGFKTNFNATYSREALDVFLNGNSLYRGREAHLAPLNTTYLEYSQLKAGLHKKTSSGTRFGVIAALNLGRRMFHSDVPFAQLYTPFDGSELRFNLLAETHYTDEPGAAPGAINGFGAGLDFYVELPLNLTDDDKHVGFLRAAVHDFGFITFNRNTKSSNIDSLYRYRGMDVGSFPQRNSDDPTLLRPDEVRAQISDDKESASKTVILPFWFRVRAFQEFEKFDITTGADFRFNANYTPYFYVHARKFLAASWKVGLITGAGGYGTGNFGFSVTYEHRGWTAGVISQNIEGVVMPNSAGGVHGGLQVQKRF